MKVINDLFDYENYKIVQDDEGFKFSLDSILLSEFVDNVDKSDEILDLCCGNAAVPLILSYYYHNKITAFEIQNSIYDLALESIKINNLENQITVINDDVKNIKNYFPGNNFRIIVANPPYFKYMESSIINSNKKKSIARHEIYLNLEDIFNICSYALKDNGYFYLVHLPERLEEIIYLCEKYKLKAKKIQFVYTKRDKSANIVLIKCVKGASNGLVVAPPLFISDYKSYKNIFRS
jgi:tRNA1(Val) A37 N6-methylase TrmN6